MNFKKEYLKSIRDVENWLDVVPERYMVRDENSPYFGMLLNSYLLSNLTEAGGAVCATGAYFCKDSKYYRDKKILGLLEQFSRKGFEKLNDDGTYDMPETNFHTAEQFGLSYLGRSLRVMNKYITDDADEQRVRSALSAFTEKVALGCLNGGFHTPNHRWVETSGLLQARQALIDAGRPALCDRLLEKAKKYLAEGIDCDEDGEWSERSAGVYSPHCDRAFLEIYEMTGNEEYYDAAYRNLMLMRYYVQNDFSMFTQNSRRKDKGEVGSRPMFFKASTYYVGAYEPKLLLAAYLKKDAFLASIADDVFDRVDTAPELASFLLHPGMDEWEFEKQSGTFPETYEKYQPKSNIVRRKENDVVYSFLADNPSFLQIDSRSIHLQVRLCSSFFAVAQFLPQSMEKTDRGYKMTMKAHGEYKLPLDNPDGVTTRDYWSIDYSSRRSIQQLDLSMSVEIVFVEGGADLYFDVAGCDRVPTKVEFFVNPGLFMYTGDTVLQTSAGGNVFVKNGSARFESRGLGVMDIDGLFCKHLYADEMRGSLDPIGGMFTLYATDFTPFEKKISIRFRRADGPVTL